MLKVNTCYGRVDSELLSRLSSIKLLAFDVDGTITDGGIYYDNKDIELKKFNVKDGFGIVALHKEGIECAVITGRSAHLTERRMEDLHVSHVIQGEMNKGIALTKLCEKLNISTDEVVCIGDDCPKDAHPFIKKIADYITVTEGGKGAVRELCDLILISKGVLNADGGFADERY